MARGKEQDVPQGTILNEKHDEWSENVERGPEIVTSSRTKT